MIRWCAYCQKHLGESAPFDEFEFSHGICQACLDAKKFVDGSALDRLRPVTEYYRRVAGAGLRKESPAVLLEAGLGLGLDPWDLLVGILQPALRRMGRLWASSQATVSDEHQLTAACSEILTLLHTSQPGFGSLRQARHPIVLLVNAEGNFHTLGIQLVEFFLLRHAVPVLTIYPGLPTRDVLQLVRSTRPAKLGISCALPAQLDSARETAEAIAALPNEERPALFVGGMALRGPASLSPEGPVRACLTAADILDLG